MKHQTQLKLNKKSRKELIIEIALVTLSAVLIGVFFALWWVEFK